jgi:hypothetical protein
MSFITKLAVAFRAFNNADHLQAAPAGVKSLTHVPASRIPVTHASPSHEVLKGSVTPDDLLDLNSVYIRNAIASLGAWTALAKGFNAFIKDTKTAEAFVTEFHAWNAACTYETQMDEKAVETTIAKLTVSKPAKGNDQTDKIIARVRKISVDAVRAERQQKAELETAKREAAMLAFTQLLWERIYDDEGTFKLSGTKAVSKALDTMQWIATNWVGEPDAIAGELLLCEADIAALERVAKAESEREGESQAVFEAKAESEDEGESQALFE